MASGAWPSSKNKADADENQQHIRSYWITTAPLAPRDDDTVEFYAPTPLNFG